MIDMDQIRQARILVVDDQLVNVQLLEYLLSASGYTNVTALRDSQRVLALHREHRYDLIILDLNMPGMDGFAVMAALREVEPHYLPVLVVTADPDKTVAALNAGARDFVGKPFDPPEVLTRIRNMIETRLMHNRLYEHGSQMEQAVREGTESLQRFRKAMDATADGIFLFDTGSMAMVDVNEGACRMLGYTRAALLAAGPAAVGLAQLASEQEQSHRGQPLPAERELVECELRRRDGDPVPVEINWQADDGILIAVARDVTERVIAQQRMRHLAHYDSLTGLPNRTLFYRTLEEAIEVARDKGWQVALVVMTLDRFKMVNDSLGAALGDELLSQFSNRLVRCVKSREAIGRLGGDEFALILARARSQQEAADVADMVREQLRAPFDLDGHHVVLTASIGIAMYPFDSTDPHTLVKFADTAMARAREAGRDGYRFFTAGMNVQVLARLDLEMALRRALEQGEFVLHYQPKVDTRTGRISGVESLLRWQRPGVGMVYPAEFVGVMEDSGMINRVGEWILDEACRQMAEWKASGVGEMQVAVNVSGRQFEGELEHVVRRALERHGIAPHCLELELTETVLMENAERAADVLVKLKALGVAVGVDDFGTGYSSLAYLKRFPLDKLKIDSAFVRDLVANPDDAAIARAIISMAHSMQLRVVAEGVESEGQWAYLQRHHCDEIQGFHFSRALPARELAELVLRNRAQPRAAAVPGSSQPTVLLVDPDVRVLAALHRLLRRENYRVLAAVSPLQGFELLALHPVQVVVCEQRMPLMSGTEFLSRVKELYPGTMRIILSGDTELASVLDSINSGSIYRFYTKPWDDAELRQNIRLAFQQFWREQAGRDPDPDQPAEK
ncbi:EAL domain-containing protein [Pseudoduganella sp. GCM10020061]|uniref:EAL domain-containing protein n=1 Tax=Pseudoduganella sp. GCM10020061 TaxID=3317345 RepID=UPI00362E1062